MIDKHLFNTQQKKTKENFHIKSLFDRNIVPSLFNTVYSHDPAASLLNFDPNTLKFSNPLSVFYTDNPSSELVDKIVQASSHLTPSQVQDFVGLAATILKTYKARQTNKDADAVNRTS